VFPYDDSAADGKPGHPDYLHKPQGKGRVDNPRDYDSWYYAQSPEAAVGEVFGDITEWGDDMFEIPVLPGAYRVLGTFELPDDLSILDLDDAQNLLHRGLRPTQVIARNRATSQAWSLRIFQEADHAGDRKWSGVRWWSFQRPQWPVMCLWNEPTQDPHHRLVNAELLYIGHPVIADAARTLGKVLPKISPSA